MGDFTPIYSIYVKYPIYKTIYIPTSWDIQVSSIETSNFFEQKKHIFKSQIVLISNTIAEKAMTLPNMFFLYLLYCSLNVYIFISHWSSQSPHPWICDCEPCGWKSYATIFSQMVVKKWWFFHGQKVKIKEQNNNSKHWKHISQIKIIPLPGYKNKQHLQPPPIDNSSFDLLFLHLFPSQLGGSS